MRPFLAFLLGLLAFAGGAGAQPAPTEPQVTARLLLSRDNLAPGASFRVAIVVDLAAPWHINANPPSLPELIPTVVTFEPPAGVVIDRITYPKGTKEKVGWVDEPVALYSGQAVILAAGTVRKDAAPGPVTITAALRYQACDNTVCYAPKTVPVSIATAFVAPTVPTRELHPEIFGTTPAEVPAGNQNSIAALIQSRGLFIALVVVFLGGLALNLTPCVYPMIAITVSYFGAREGRTRALAFAGAFVYCLGIVISYSVLGVIAALTGGLFGALLQSKWVLLGVSTLLVILALSMFGLFEIRPPQFLVQRAAGMSARAGHLGVFFLGATMGIVAAPCLAPFAVALLAYVGTSRQWWWFLVFSCGLAVPYLVLGTFSGLLSQLPKSGTWMVWVKRVFGVAMIAVAVWFAWPVLGPKTATASPIAWQPYAPAAVAQAGQPVLIDFYADWCIPCHEMENRTFPDPRIVEKSRQFLMLKADLTRTGSPAVDKLVEQFKILGVPTYVFLDANGREHGNLRQVGFINADQFVKLMDRALAAPATSLATTNAPDIPPQLLHPF